MLKLLLLRFDLMWICCAGTCCTTCCTVVPLLYSKLHNKYASNRTIAVSVNAMLE